MASAKISRRHDFVAPIRYCIGIDFSLEEVQVIKDGTQYLNKKLGWECFVLDRLDWASDRLRFVKSEPFYDDPKWVKASYLRATNSVYLYPNWSSMIINGNTRRFNIIVHELWHVLNGGHSGNWFSINYPRLGIWWWLIWGRRGFSAWETRILREAYPEVQYGV